MKILIVYLTHPKKGYKYSTRNIVKRDAKLGKKKLRMV